jgi:hypothetical protein
MLNVMDIKGSRDVSRNYIGEEIHTSTLAVRINWPILNMVNFVGHHGGATRKSLRTSGQSD